MVGSSFFLAGRFLLNPILVPRRIWISTAREARRGNNWAPLDAGNTLKEAIEKHLNSLLQMPEDELIEERYKKFRVLGKFIEANNIEEIYSEIP